MKRIKLTLLAFLVCFVVSLPLGRPVGAADKIPVILDTDMVDMFDDGFAMIMLAQSPKIELLGVTTVVGNTWVETGVASAIRQLEGINRLDIPVMPGTNRPIRSGRFEGMEAEIKLFGHGDDPQFGAAGYPEPASWREAYTSNYKAEPQGKPASEQAVAFLIRKIKERPGEITIVAIGTCANLAAAVREAPEIVPLVKRVVYMGGAFFQPGNVTSNAEFNFWLDPESARIALRTPFKEQVIFPLDVCEKIHFDYTHYQKIKNSLHKPLFQEMFAHHWTTGAFANNKNFYTYVWDVLAAAAVIDPSIIKEEVTYPVDINDSFSPSYGQSIAYKGAGPVGTQKARIILKVDEDMLWQMIDATCTTL